MYYRIIRKTILLVGLIILLFAIFINLAIILSSYKKIFYSVNDLPKAEVGLLLGTTKYVPGGKENLFYNYRIIAAKKLLDSGKIEKIILSGSRDGGYDEVRWMKNDLMNLGVSEEKMIFDKSGNRTEDSIENIIEKKYNNFIIISQYFHLERAIFLAALKGKVAYGFVAESPNFKYSSKIYAREFLSRIKLMFVDILFY